MFKGLLNFIINLIGGQEYINIFMALVSAAAAGIIAFATWRYTNYSKKNLEELKNQNEYLKKSEERKYKLERKSICKKLSYEITQNEVRLNELQNFFNSKISEDFSKTKSYFKNKGYKNLLKNSIYRRFIESNIDFISDEIFESIFTFYSNIEHIKQHTELIAIANKVSLDVHSNIINKLVKDNLEKIECLYNLFKEETGYNHKESKFYKGQKEVIELFKGLEILG